MSTEGSGEDTKRCGGCGEAKQLYEFYKRRRGGDALGYYCKRCQAERVARYREYHRKNFLLGLARPVAEKKCCTCNSVKPATEFQKDTGRPDGLMPRCKACRITGKRKSKYGINKDEYEALAISQSMACAICRSGGVMHVDHCHSSGPVRGLLCRLCNLMLGYAKDSESTLFAAIHYLRNPPAYQILKKDDPRK